MVTKIALGFLSLSLALTLQASNTAFDQANNSPYEPGNTWTNGQNGGTGFGAWVLTTTSGVTSQNGFFMGSSSGNGNGSSGNINTAGVSWGMYANSGQTASAVRPFTGGDLLVGQSVTLEMDNGFLTSGSSEGFGLQTSGGANRLEFYFLGGTAGYTLADGSGTNVTSIPFTSDGLAIKFTLTGINMYSLSVKTNPNGTGGSTTNFNGTLEGVAGTGIDQLRFFDFNGGNGQGSAGDFYANLLTVPEPSTWFAGALSILGALLFARRRRVKA
jgi:PEP-CTERM motif